MEKKIRLNEIEKNDIIKNACKNLEEKYNKFMKDSLEKFKKKIDLLLEEKKKGLEKYFNKASQLEQFN
jgi:ribosomal protein S17E